MMYSMKITRQRFRCGGGGPEKKPSKFDFDLSFSENMLVVDYGKTTVNTYRASYAPLVDDWGDEWFVYGYGVLADWCIGCDLSIYDDKRESTEFFIPDYNNSILNAQNVCLISLNEIDDYEAIAQRLDILPDSQILCWTYDVKDFPDKYAQYMEFTTIVDIKEMKYARISSQYVDNIPTYGTTSCYGECTFDWEGIIKPSRIADEGILDSGRINPTRTFYFEPGRGKYHVEEALISESPVVSPETCLDEIKRAIKYYPCAVIGNAEILDIWEKNIEVYCMELTYCPLDPCPRNPDESESSHQLHELCLVPAWQVYYTVADPNSDRVCCGKVLINAVTGKSLFSDEYGPGENTELYPDLLLHG